jgi:hypothetical protein
MRIVPVSVHSLYKHPASVTRFCAEGPIKEEKLWGIPKAHFEKLEQALEKLNELIDALPKKQKKALQDAQKGIQTSYIYPNVREVQQSYTGVVVASKAVGRQLEKLINAHQEQFNGIVIKVHVQRLNYRA